MQPAGAMSIQIVLLQDWKHYFQHKESRTLLFKLWEAGLGMDRCRLFRYLSYLPDYLMFKTSVLQKQESERPV